MVSVAACCAGARGSIPGQVEKDFSLLNQVNRMKRKIQTGAAGRRSLDFSKARRALYQLSYIDVESRPNFFIQIHFILFCFLSYSVPFLAVFFLPLSRYLAIFLSGFGRAVFLSYFLSFFSSSFLSFFLSGGCLVADRVVGGLDRASTVRLRFYRVSRCFETRFTGFYGFLFVPLFFTRFSWL